MESSRVTQIGARWIAFRSDSPDLPDRPHKAEICPLTMDTLALSLAIRATIQAPELLTSKRLKALMSLASGMLGCFAQMQFLPDVLWNG